MNVQHDDPALGAVRLTAIGGILGAIAASACCIAPLLLFSLGISGAWIGNLTALASYQPYFIAATLACLGYGYWLVYRRKKIACTFDDTKTGVKSLTQGTAGAGYPSFLYTEGMLWP